MRQPLRFDERARGGNLLAGVLGRLFVTVPLLVVGGVLLVSVGLGAPGWLVWLLLAAFVAAFVGPLWVLIRLRRLAGTLEFGPDGVVRTSAGERREIDWAGVRTLTVVPNYLTSESLVVLATEPPEALVPGAGRWLGRLNARLYGGAVVVGLSACGLPEQEARERLFAYDPRTTDPRR